MPGVQTTKLWDSQADMLRTEDQCKDDTDLALCLLCMEIPSSPVVLDCGHIVCLQCIIDYMDDYEVEGADTEADQWTCPTCLEPSKVHSEAHIPEEVPTKELLKSTKSLNPSVNPQPCDVCVFSGKTAETEVHCGRCYLNLCGECKEVHGNHPLFKLHSVVHIANKDSVALYCEEHNNTQSHYFCDDCRKPCCTVCLMVEHSSHKASTLLDALNQHKDKMKSQLNVIVPQLNKIESKIQTLAQIAERRTHGSSFRYIRSVSEPSKEFSASVDSQSSDISENEASQLLSRLQGENNRTPKGTPKRKHSSVDHDKIQKNPTPQGAAIRRKPSFFDHFRSKKMSDPHIEETLLAGGSNSLMLMYPAMGLHESTNPKTPSPFLMRKTSRQSISSKKSSTSSIVVPWHQFTRMGKSSPVLQRKMMPSQPSSHTTPDASPKQEMQEPRFMMIEPPIAVDTEKLGRYRHKLQLLRKLSNHASRTFSAKRYLDAFDELEQRLNAAINVEIAQLKASVQEMMDQHEAAFHALSMTPSASVSSMDLVGGVPMRRKSCAVPAEDSINGTVPAAAQLTLLIKPEVLWKFEKHSGELWNRCGIAFMPNGDTVVAEYDMNNMRNNRLHIYDSKGVTVKVICEGQMCPLGVAVTPEGHIAVTDCKSKRVKIVTEAGHPVCDWGKGHFGWPHGIAVNSRGQFIVSDAFNDTISIHQPDGKKIKQFGSSGTGNSCFRNPFHIAIDHSDNIIVSDCGNNCIKVFNPEGEFLFCNRGVSSSSIEGHDGNKNRRLKGPRGVTVDPKGNILVADDSSRVVMFDSRGRYIRNVLTEEEHVKLSGEEHVKFVEGMAMNREGVLALTECNPSQMFAVKVFKLYEVS